MDEATGQRRDYEQGRLPLVGIRVLELGHIVAGPSAGLMLADLGADTIKIENPSAGDQSRTWTASQFSFLNRNKRSLAIDLKTDEGMSAFLRLAETTDVVINNFSPQSIDHLQISYSKLHAINPRLIFLSIRGFLPGPYGDLPLLDELAQMMGGLAYMTGPPGTPMRTGSSVIDIGSATYGCMAVMAALVARTRTGRGQEIIAGLFETAVFWVGQWMAAASESGQPSMPAPVRKVGTTMGWGVYNVFEGSDGHQIFIAATSDKHWIHLTRVLELHELADDERLDSNQKRVAARDWVLPILRDRCRTYAASDLVDRLRNAGVPAVPVLRPDELLDERHLQVSSQLLPVTMSSGTVAPLPKLPFRSSEYDFGMRMPVPGLGQHTRELLSEVGYSGQEIDALVANGLAREGTSWTHE